MAFGFQFSSDARRPTLFPFKLIFGKCLKCLSGRGTLQLEPTVTALK